MDAVLVLFDWAAHFADTMPPGTRGLVATAWPGRRSSARPRPTMPRGHILTAHRSKCLSGVLWWWQAGRLRRSAAARSLFRIDELAETAGPASSGSESGTDVDAAMLAAKLLVYEHRPFYVAVTRVRQLYVVPAVDGEDTDERSFRLLTDPPMATSSPARSLAPATLAIRALRVPTCAVPCSALRPRRPQFEPSRLTGRTT
jgi:hypothetical protein